MVMINLASGLTDKNIDMNGHLGGLFSGVLLGFILRPNKTENVENNNKMAIGEMYSMVILMVYFAAGFLTFFWPKIIGN